MIDYKKIPTPCFVLDESKLEANLKLLQDFSLQAGVEIILAFKGFAMWHSFPLIKKYLKGATASSLHEAMLCKEEMGHNAHTYMVAFPPDEFEQIASMSSHLTFNSLSQWDKFGSQLPDSVSAGLRINPGWSDVTTDLYNPGKADSRLGVSTGQIFDRLPEGCEGLHCHVLCESGADALEKLLFEIERKFGHLFGQIKWLNLGGGHLITNKSYDIIRAARCLKDFQERHAIKLIMEPGSAVAWETGDLRASVLDIVSNGGVKTAVADISFTCHMPDCLEMPYQPEVMHASMMNSAGSYKYRIGGMSCLAGDFIGDYFFEKKIEVGDDLIFKDMMHYTMVKTNTFNGIQHPSIGVWRSNRFELIKKFG